MEFPQFGHCRGSPLTGCSNLQPNLQEFLGPRAVGEEYLTCQRQFFNGISENSEHSMITQEDWALTWVMAFMLTCPYTIVFSFLFWLEINRIGILLWTLSILGEEHFFPMIFWNFKNWMQLPRPRKTIFFSETLKTECNCHDQGKQYFYNFYFYT